MLWVIPWCKLFSAWKLTPSSVPLLETCVLLLTPRPSFSKLNFYYNEKNLISLKEAHGAYSINSEMHLIREVAMVPPQVPCSGSRPIFSFIDRDKIKRPRQKSFRYLSIMASLQCQRSESRRRWKSLTRHSICFYRHNAFKSCCAAAAKAQAKQNGAQEAKEETRSWRPP